jgi:Flp pilus assembly protein TadB
VVAVTAVALACGALFGLGVALLLAGWRGVDPAVAGRARRALRDRGLLLRAALATAALLVVGLSTGWPVAAVGAAALAALAPSLLGAKAERARAVAKVEAIATWTEMLRDTVGAGAGLGEAIRAIAAVGPAPLAAPLARLSVRLEHESLPVALRDFAEELADPTADLVVAALVLAATEQARRLGDLLGALAEATREQAAMRLRVDASRARTRATAAGVAGIAVAAAVGFLAFDRPFLHPYDSAQGQVVLALIGACFACAFWMLARMGHVAVPSRLRLATEPDQVWS